MRAAKKRVSANHPLLPFLQAQGVVILDGALATELEQRGADLRDPLWSAKVLLENPMLIRQTHLDYLRAGADVITTATYQATFAGFARRGIGRAEAARLMRLSAELAQAARDEFWDEFCTEVDHDAGRLRPLVAASIGPYGAYLAGGQEYSGDYGLSREELVEFHAPRLEVLARCGADLLACETIPTLVEVEALVRVLEQFPDVRTWLSCSCGDTQNLWHGEPLAAVVEIANACPQVVAVGVNCTAPHLVTPLLQGVQAMAEKPLIAYPNRGEAWDATMMCWVGGSGVASFTDLVQEWYDAGARLIGGCCRTTPADIAALAARLLS